MARRSAGTGARTPTASPPGARPAGPCRSGPAPARPAWRPSAARATTTDVGSVGLDASPRPRADVSSSAWQGPGGIDQPSFDATTFTKNRKRLLEHEVAHEVFAADVRQ